MSHITRKGLGLSLKWGTLLQGRHLVKMFCVQTVALLLLLFLTTQSCLFGNGSDHGFNREIFEDGELTVLFLGFLLLTPFMAVGTLHSLLSAHSRQFHLMMPATTAERYVAQLALAAGWCTVAYLLSFFVADLLRWVVFSACGRGSLGLLVTIDWNTIWDSVRFFCLSFDSLESNHFLSLWLLYVAGGWWCALFFNKHWLVAFGLLCVAYPCLFVMSTYIFLDYQSAMILRIILNLTLLGFASWHSWRLFARKRMKKTNG